MTLLTSNDLSLMELEQKAKTELCGECGDLLICPWSPEHDAIILVCSQDRDHRGYTKPKSLTRLYEEGTALHPAIANKIENRRTKQMKDEHGAATSTALEKYQGVTSLTKQQATEIIRSFWPSAPDPEVFKAALTCQMYGLNPLMKHLFLLPFKGRTGAVTWAQVLGIKATRLICSRKSRYSYKEGPRIMTDDEQKRLRGEIDPKNLWAITVLADAEGNEAPGYGCWPKHEEPYGTEKGNSKQNMAMIRSERAALERLLPGEMPMGIEVMDETYMDRGQEIEPVVEAIEGDFLEVPQGERVSDIVAPSTEKEDWLTTCPEHDVPWQPGKSGRPPFHHLQGGGFCGQEKILKAKWDNTTTKAVEIGWTAQEINGFLDRLLGEHYWSKLTAEQQVQAIHELKGKLDQRPKMPLGDQPPTPKDDLPFRETDEDIDVDIS